MKILTRNECAAFLLSHDNFTILSHRRPDGDTIGSSAALCMGLRSLGKTAHVLRNMEVTEKYLHLHQGLTKDCPETGDTLIAVDTAAPQLLPEAYSHLAKFVRLRIDHHGSGREYCPTEFVDSESASCAEIIWELLLDMDVELEPEIADGIYVGVSTDTGCFRYANTTAHTFAVAAVCASAGARVYELNQELFETNTLGRLRMQAWIVDHMKLLKGGEMAIVAIPKAVEEEIGVTGDDMDNISSFPRTVAGVCMAATLRETAEGDTKISVRAVPGYDATKVTVRFGGGGHKGAAGATLYCPPEEAARRVAEAMLADA